MADLTPHLRTAAAFALALTVGCAALATNPSVPARHAEKLPPGKADCLECHEDAATGNLKPYGTFRHTAVFLQEHGRYAAQGQNLCSSCHGLGFCQECHAASEELLPSVSHPNRPDRSLPHRGDYMIQHRIDGRLDPASCARCHGTTNRRSCEACHK